jgi:ATP-dependent Clp protease protease subunit
VEIFTRYLLKAKEITSKILAYHTGQAYEKILQDTDRDNFMTAEEAREYGIVDEILMPRGTAR